MRAFAPLLRRPGLLLATSGLLLLIGSLGSWRSVGSFPDSGWDTGLGKITFFASLILLTSAALNLGYLDHPLLHRLFPLLPTSSLCGFLSLLTCLVGFDTLPRPSWGLYLSTVASLLSLFAAYRSLQGGG